ncbi:WD40-repeat-containing domain protein [Zopfochytrium polystomum]|nr:WD40-repeat-containing domain protein [Zopfochytrium polystomum]
MNGSAIEIDPSPALDKPQIITVASRSLTYTPYDVRWIPCSARFVVLGQHARGTGALQVLELEKGKIVMVHEVEKKHAFKCGTFAASSLQTRHLACGDFDGTLSLYDLERTELPVFSVKAHEQIINCIDGAGGVGVKTGPPEVATGGRDGVVKVWDVRQKDAPVASIAPPEGHASRDVWTVAFGNSYTDTDRMLCAGYENGDVKLFDLRTMSQHWETNVRNGVCSVEFDRKDVPMNKLVVATLESTVHAFEMRTKHPTAGFAAVVKKNTDNTTIWTVRHLPQNRDVFLTSCGNGKLHLYKYHYPSQRQRKNAKDDQPEGVPGQLDRLNHAVVAEQPVSSFDWSPDKMGLFACSAFDQQVRVGCVTRLESV